MLAGHDLYDSTTVQDPFQPFSLPETIDLSNLCIGIPKVMLVLFSLLPWFSFHLYFDIWLSVCHIWQPLSHVIYLNVLLCSCLYTNLVKRKLFKSYLCIDDWIFQNLAYGRPCYTSLERDNHICSKCWPCSIK